MPQGMITGWASPSQSVPQEAWERLYEAAARGAADPSLRGRVAAEILAQLHPDNLWVLAVLLAVWAAATLYGGPFGWVVSSGVVVAGWVALGKDVIDISTHFYRWATGAYAATTQAQLDQAAQEFAAGLVEGGAALFNLVLSTTAFNAVKKIVLRIKPRRWTQDQRAAEESGKPKAEESGKSKAEESGNSRTEQGGKPKAEESSKRRWEDIARPQPLPTPDPKPGGSDLIRLGVLGLVGWAGVKAAQKIRAAQKQREEDARRSAT